MSVFFRSIKRSMSPLLEDRLNLYTAVSNRGDWRVQACIGFYSRLFRGVRRMSVAIGWCLISVGFLTGAVFGLLAKGEDWLGGYASRTRRLLKLGHNDVTK